jgi:hypothetical protein
MQRAHWKPAAGTYPQIRRRVLQLIVQTIGTHDVVDLAHSPTIAIGDAARIRAIVAVAIEAVRGGAQDCALARCRRVIGAAVFVGRVGQVRGRGKSQPRRLSGLGRRENWGWLLKLPPPRALRVAEGGRARELRSQAAEGEQDGQPTTQAKPHRDRHNLGSSDWAGSRLPVVRSSPAEL